MLLSIITVARLCYARNINGTSMLFRVVYSGEDCVFFELERILSGLKCFLVILQVVHFPETVHPVSSAVCSIAGGGQDDENGII